MPPGRLVVCATPIGNLGDVSPRLAESLASADVVFAEDTRRTLKLLSHLGIRVPVVSLFAGNEQARTAQLLEAVEAGDAVALVSDAGMPAISDPGAAAVRAVRAAGYPVTVVPGPSAVTTALTLSGLGGDSFSFEGFLPRKGAERDRRLKRIAGEDRPVVLFASPRRLGADLADLATVCGRDRVVLVMRELTKVHEEVWQGTLSEAAAHWADGAKGEVTVVLAPGGPAPGSLENAVGEALAMTADGLSVSEAARRAASEHGVSRREIYEELLRLQESS